MELHRLRSLLVIVALPLAVTTSVAARPKRAQRPDPSASGIAARVQTLYDKTRSFQAGFEQRYWVKAYNKLKVSRGKVVFRKPGKMSWRYSTNGNRIVSDGKRVLVYEAQNKQMYEQPMGSSQYPAALAFLIGGGNLTKQFTLRKLSSKDLKFPGGFVLEGVPKTPTPAYERLILFVDAGTSQVRRVLLLDAQGNRNRFDFDRPVFGRNVAASEFVFTPPPGTQVIRP